MTLSMEFSLAFRLCSLSGRFLVLLSIEPVLKITSFGDNTLYFDIRWSFGVLVYCPPRTLN